MPVKTENAVGEKNVKGSTGWKVAGVALCIAGALIAVGSAVVTMRDIYKYYHKDMAPIPRKIVHESSDSKGRSVYTVYDVTLCNRQAQGFTKEQTGDYGDMNGDVGKQWLALYTTKDKAAGDPITADIIAQKGSNVMPTNKTTGIRLFGKTDMVNIVSEEYGYNDKLTGLYIFSGTAAANSAEKPAENNDSSAAPADTSSAADISSAAETTSAADSSSTGSVVGTGTMVASCAGSAALGALICFFIVRRKKGGNAAA